MTTLKVQCVNDYHEAIDMAGFLTLWGYSFSAGEVGDEYVFVVDETTGNANCSVTELIKEELPAFKKEDNHGNP